MLDYNSLYPSSIISNNISHETYVTSPEFDNLPNYVYNDVIVNNNDGTTMKCRFAKLKNINDDVSKSKFGIIPSILLGLLVERKATKKEMEKETYNFKKSILDGKQIALKVTANSIYGQLGAYTSPICFKEGAACTTAVGREMLVLAKEFVETRLVDILSELYILKKNKSNELYEEYLIKNLKEEDNKFKLYLETYLLEIFDNYLISPKVIYGDSVMPYTPILLKLDNVIKISTIEDLGNKFNWNNYDEFKKFDTSLTSKEKIDMNNYNIYSYTDKGWSLIKKVIRHKCNKSIYRINTNYGLVDVTEDHSLIDLNRNLIKPTELNMTTILLHSFPLLEFEFINMDNDAIIKIKDQYMAQICYYFLKKSGYIINISYNDEYYILKIVEKEMTYEIKKIEKIYNNNEYNGYVYDIETEYGVFQAGIGELIVKNTDSIFINMDFKDKTTKKDLYDIKTLKYSIYLGECASIFLKKLLEYPQNMEYEKTFYPFTLLAKKKYIGYKYEKDIYKKTQVSTGVVLKRRDNANIVKKIIGGMVNIMLDEIDIDKTIEFIRKSITDLLNGKYDMNDFITSKTLRSNYKGKKKTSKFILFKLTNIIKQEVNDIIYKGQYQNYIIMIMIH